MSDFDNARSQNPGLIRYVLRGILDEAVAFGWMLRREWPIALVALLVFALLVFVFEPLPPSVIRLAKGQPNSGLEVMAKKYRDYLASYGVEVEFVDSDGAPANLQLVSSGKADAGLSQSGLEAPADVHYLGSVAYQPFWLFHAGKRGQAEDLVSFLDGKRVSIGSQGSGSHRMSNLFLGELDERARKRMSVRALNNADTLRGLKSGELDAAFLLASYESKNVQTLINDPDIGVMSFSHVQGFSNRHRHLHSVSLPAGSLRYYPANPPKDVTMFAATMTLVVNSDLHPALQYLLLTASRDIAEHGSDIVSKQGEFPAFVDRTLPKSPIAERFYREGEPYFMTRLPYWLATLIDDIWVSLIAFGAVIYSLMSAMPAFRSLTFDAISSRRYDALRVIESRFFGSAAREEKLACLRDVELLLEDVRRLWVPNGCSAAHGGLLSTVLQVEQKLQQALAEEDGSSASGSSSLATRADAEGPARSGSDATRADADHRLPVA